MRTPLKILKRHQNGILVVGALFALASLVVTLMLPLQYRADAEVLVITKARYGVDAYTSEKSAERVGERLAEVVGKEDFLNKVSALNEYAINWGPLYSLDLRKRLKRWNKKVEARVVYGTGVLHISSYDTDRNQARLLAAAVSSALANQGWEYASSDVTIRIVNSPVVSPWPVRPNIIVNTVAGLVVGIVVASILFVRKRTSHFFHS